MSVRKRTAPRRPREKRPSPLGGVHWLLVFFLFLAAAFIEVWESTAVSQLALDIDRLQVQVRDTDARKSYLEARTAEAGSRVRLASYARALDMRPADPSQVVVIPRDYLAMAAPASDVPENGWAALSRRGVELFVSAARARARSESADE